MKKLMLILLVFVVAAAPALAEELAVWDVNGVDVADGTKIDESVSPYAFTAGKLGSNVSDAKLTLSDNVSPSTVASRYGLKILSENDPKSTSLLEAISNNHYMQFTVSAFEGYRLNFSSIQMSGGGTATSPNNVALLSSVGGFIDSEAIAEVSNVTSDGSMDTDSLGWGGPIDLSGQDYQGLENKVTFRLYMWNASGAYDTRIENGNIVDNNDLIINGTTAVIPEPASLTLLGLFGVVLVLRRRVRA